MIGRTLGHYRIEAKLGEGGMGVVYRAFDTHLDRLVALKVLPPEKVADPERKRRFVREAKAASALNHPNIITIHDSDTAAGVNFIVMEYVDGRSLDRLIAGGPLPLEEALGYAVQIASAMAAAHAAGILHRDIKPANIMVRTSSQIKVLDFGLAKLSERVAADPSAPTQTTPTRTKEGVILGTVAYMSPEQAEGKPVDGRADVFSFGAVLYEMLAGQRPFQGDSNLSILTAILHRQPAPLKKLRPDVPSDLEGIVVRSLEKDRDRRYPSAAELWKDLVACHSRLTTPSLRALLRKRQVAVPAFLLLLAVLAAGTWLGVRSYRARWARNVALPKIAQLVEQRDYTAALALARQAERYIPDDPMLRRLWPVMSRTISIYSDPDGADVYMKDYSAADTGWQYLGRSPLNEIRIPVGFFRWKVEKQGFDSIEVANSGAAASDWPPQNGTVLKFASWRRGSNPVDMVYVPGELFQSPTGPVHLGDYLIDKFEVTNRQFRKFVESGAYRKREYWKYPFVKDHGVLSWEQAVQEFRDQTGRPGPSTWDLGNYPPGQDDYPVTGVSWYEAAAYAEFAGKTLPTIYHWFKAAGLGVFSHILGFSNFGGRGPARVASYGGLGFFGTYDMAGNVKEWCWNQTSANRYLLGGAWTEASYMFSDPDARPPLDRSATSGFRCIRHLGTDPVPQVLTGEANLKTHASGMFLLVRPAAEVFTLSHRARDYKEEKPVPDAIFRTYSSLYSYDRIPLNPVVESVDDNSEFWRKERITFNAAYRSERIIANLFLPKGVASPYQTVVYFPHLGTIASRSSENVEDVEMRWIDFIVKSGRSLLFPVYKGTYERPADVSQGVYAARDLAIEQTKDLSRSVDYLESRKDIDRERLAFYGFSWGAVEAPRLLAMEKRFKAAVLLGGGFDISNWSLPEVDPFNFASRVSVPVLMINGRHDFLVSLATAQVPMFRLLGSSNKRHLLFDTGHVPPRTEFIKEALDWLDRYLGPAK